MPTRNERKIRAGYDLFLAARPDRDEDWGPDSPVAALMADEIVWDDKEQHPIDREAPTHFERKGNGQDKANLTNPTDAGGGVLGRLRQLRSQMCCQILSCIEDEKNENVVHTVDHALTKVDEKSMRPHFCASRFEFNDQGKVVSVEYCSGDLALDRPAESTS
jgi:hypothetical protein